MTFTESMLSDLCNLALEDGFAQSLNTTLSQFDSGTNSIIVNLMRNSVFAIGAALLTLFMLMELVAMDNASFHRKEKLYCLAEKHNCFVIFLPTYSSDLNPIEHFWNWLKNTLREILPNFSSFDDALTAAFQLKEQLHFV